MADSSAASVVVSTSTRKYRRSGALAILAAAAALGLAACGGAAPADAPHVASLGTTTTTDHSGQGGTTTSPDNGNPTHLMDEWAACMRTNGDPDQTDPTVDQYGVINITMPLGVSETLSSEVHGSTGPCSQYEIAAQDALRGSSSAPAGPSYGALVQYTDCMRTHGVPKYPDPGPDGSTNFNGTGVDPNSPFVEHANDICGKQINAPSWWIAGTGPPGDVVVSSAGIGPNGPTPGNQPKREVPAPGANSGSGSNG